MVKREADIGIIGLGVMGRNLALNIADHGFKVAGLDRDKEKVDALVDAGDSERVFPTTSVEDFTGFLNKPRAAMLLVPAGKPVDAVLSELKDHFDKGDVIIDGGNSHFTDTDRRAAELASSEIDFLGVGVSGGAEGARYGPSMMPGGPKRAYDRIRPIFEAISAEVDGEPCVTYLGPGSAGHYVKMVHNGIEYALMQLISEVYDILGRVVRLSNDEMADLFASWNESALSSFLLEITSGILRVPDDQTDQRLIDLVLDAARQKGTGKWTSQDAMELQAPVPTIDAAVGARDLSGYKEERKLAAKIHPTSEHPQVENKQALIEHLRSSLQFGMIASYAQGLAQLRAASQKCEYDLKPADIARIWRGGCIIRAALLEDIRKAYRQNPHIANLMTESPFAESLKDLRGPLCDTIAIAQACEIAVPALSSVLAYFDGYRTFRLPANLIQAQRDCFGSHTYERIDREGTFHTDWLNRKGQ